MNRADVARIVLVLCATIATLAALASGQLDGEQVGRIVAALLAFLASFAPRPPGAGLLTVGGGARPSSARVDKVARGVQAGAVVLAVSEAVAGVL